MLGVGYKFPEFSLVATIGTERDKSFTMLSDTDFDGKWKVYFFWPKDFTFVCPTEIATFGKLNREFEDRDAQLLGGSTDSEYVHLAWRQNHEDLKDLPFPMLADIKRELCAALGILDPNEGVAQRATYIVDPQNAFASFRLTICRLAAIRTKCFWTKPPRKSALKLSKLPKLPRRLWR